MRLDTARRFCLSLPETTEEPHFEKSSFRVKGKIFATVPEGGKQVHVFVGVDEAKALVEEDPVAFEEIRWGKDDSPWVRVHLAKADRVHVLELLEEAWRQKVPPKVLRAHDTARGSLPS